MFAADYLRRCKYKEKFANNIHCGLFFCKFTPFSSKSAIPAPVFFHYTSFYSFCLQMYETKTKNGRNGATISSISYYLGKSMKKSYVVRWLWQLIAVDKGFLLKVFLIFAGIGTNGIHRAVVEREEPVIGLYLFPYLIDESLIFTQIGHMRRKKPHIGSIVKKSIRLSIIVV